MIPRIRGKVGQVEIDGKLTDKWSFQIWISELGSGDVNLADKVKLNPPIFSTKAEAMLGLHEAVRIAHKVISELIGAIPNEYIDMKTNERRRWDDVN